MRSRAHRGLREAITALRHVDYNNLKHHNVQTMEHGVRSVEYFYQLSKDIEDVNRRLQGYRAKIRERETTINKLKKTGPGDAALPVGFFEIQLEAEEVSET